MFDFFKRNKKYLIAALIFLAFLQFLSYKIKDKQKLSFVDRSFIFLISPMQSLFTSFNNRVSNVFENYINLIDVKKNNKKVLEENKILKMKINDLTEFEVENRELKRMLEFKEEAPFEMQAAAIIARDISSFGKTIRINLGEDDGIKKDMAVIGYDGIVGKIIDVYKTCSDVLLVIDVNSSVDVMIQRTRARGIIRGKQEAPLVLSMDFVSKDDDVVVGDIVITSGMGMIWPKGLMIGEVFDSKRDVEGMFYTINVKPSVNFYRLERVFVVVK